MLVPSSQEVAEKTYDNKLEIGKSCDLRPSISTNRRRIAMFTPGWTEVPWQRNNRVKPLIHRKVRSPGASRFKKHLRNLRVKSPGQKIHDLGLKIHVKKFETKFVVSVIFLTKS